MTPRIPELLEALVVAARWPATRDQERTQNLTSLVSAERVAAFALEEKHLYLYAPPFHTATYYFTHGEEFWGWASSAPKGIDRNQTIVIGDFGLGSDAPIVLDYRSGSPPPRVLRLRSVNGARPEDNTWTEIAPSFARFIEMLGI